MMDTFPERMNPEIKARWVAALRSGQYRQGKGRLCCEMGGGSSYCCLGVLCEIAVQDGIVQRIEANGVQYGKPGTDDIDGTILPQAVAGWAQLAADGFIQRRTWAECPNGAISGGVPCEKSNCVACRNVSLTSLNDSLPGKYDFHCIADVIETWL